MATTKEKKDEEAFEAALEQASINFEKKHSMWTGLHRASIGEDIEQLRERLEALEAKTLGFHKVEECPRTKEIPEYILCKAQYVDKETFDLALEVAYLQFGSPASHPLERPAHYEVKFHCKHDEKDGVMRPFIYQWFDDEEDEHCVHLCEKHHASFEQFEKRMLRRRQDSHLENTVSLLRRVCDRMEVQSALLREVIVGPKQDEEACVKCGKEGETHEDSRMCDRCHNKLKMEIGQARIQEAIQRFKIT
jgi:hypothetical protein